MNTNSSSHEPRDDCAFVVRATNILFSTAFLRACVLAVALGAAALAESALAMSAWRNGEARYKPASRFAYGNGHFVAIDPGGYVSKDGRHWWSFPAPELPVRDFSHAGPPMPVFQIIFADGLFVALGGISAEKVAAETWIAISTNGFGWKRTLLPPGGEIEAAGIHYGAGQLIVEFQPNFPGGAHEFMVSENGVDWRPTNAPPWLGNQLFLGNDVVSYNDQGVFSSSAGAPFEKRASQSFQSMLHGDGRFLAISNSTLYSSTDLVEWTETPTVLPAGLRLVAVFNHSFFGAVGSKVYKLDAAFQWQPVVDFGAPWVALTAGPTRLVASFQKTGSAPEFRTTADGVNWEAPIFETPAASVTTANLRDVAYGSLDSGAPVFVTVGDGGTVLRSDDGFAWSVCDSGTAANLTQVVFGNGTFVIPLGGTFLISRDGREWSRQAGPGTGPMAFGNGMFIRMDSQTYVSTDLDQWTTNAFAQKLLGFGDGKFYAFDQDCCDARILASTDGQNWIEIQRFGLIDNLVLNAADAGGGEVVAVGSAYIHSTVRGGIYGFVASLESAISCGPVADVVRTGTDFIGSLQDGSLFFGKPKAWNFVPSTGPIAGFSATTYGGGKFVAVGPSGTIVTFSEQPSIEWSERGTGVGLHLWGMLGRAYAIQSSNSVGPTAEWRNEKEITVRSFPERLLDAVPTGSSPTFYRAVLK